VPVLIGSGLIRKSPPEWVSFVLDISERKHLEELRENFIAAVTHELRTPLVSIKAYADYMADGKMGDLPEKAAAGAKIVKEQTDRLLSLTEQLLDQRRLLLGRFDLNLTSLDPSEIIEESARQLKPLLEMRNQKLDVQTSGPSKLLADRERLAQVVTNLLTNASKFTPENGNIIVKTERTDASFRISVTDTGIGIGKEDLTRVFEPFALVKKPSYVQGSGLGLSVSKGIVEAHGGSIWAESAGPGKGSTFIVEIRLQENEAEPDRNA
jgi:signal transduction histidine kinase